VILSHIDYPYLLFPFVIWAALRFGVRGASLMTLTVATVTVWHTLQGSRPFVAIPYYAWNNRGQAKMRVGDKKGAIADFRKALELEPGRLGSPGDGQLVGVGQALLGLDHQGVTHVFDSLSWSSRRPSGHRCPTPSSRMLHTRPPRSAAMRSSGPDEWSRLTG